MKHPRTGRFQRAFTLIEVVGVLTVIAILTAILVPALIRQMDRFAGEQETATLRSMGDALRQSILRNRYIPALTNLVSTIVTELGVNVSDVTTNARKNPRYFLFDPNLGIGGAGLPYQQTSIGSSSSPTNVRVVLLSSIGQRFTNMVSGTPSASDFNAIWDWNDASSTAPSASLLSGFSRGDDLKIQRLDVSPLFVRLVLTAYGSSGSPGYSIDSTNWGTAIIVTNGGAGIDRYFLQNSILALHTHLGILDSRQILIRDNSFVYNEDVWRASIIGAVSIGGLDITTVVDKFLKAPPNFNDNVPYGTNQQRIIVTNMMAYMDAYIDWAGAGFPSGFLKNTANSKQDEMITSIRSIYEPGGGANDYTPVNTNACTPF